MTWIGIGAPQGANVAMGNDRDFAEFSFAGRDNMRSPAMPAYYQSANPMLPSYNK